MVNLCQLCSYLTLFAHFLAFISAPWITLAVHKILIFSCISLKINQFLKKTVKNRGYSDHWSNLHMCFRGRIFFWGAVFICTWDTSLELASEKTFTTLNTQCSAKKLKLLNNWQEQLKVGKATQDNQKQLHILSMKQCFFCCKVFLE